MHHDEQPDGAHGTAVERAWYSDLVAICSDPVVAVSEGHVVTANAAARSLLDLPGNATVGRPFEALVHADDRSRVAELGAPWEGELRLLAAGGVVAARAAIHRLPLAGAPAWQVCLRLWNRCEAEVVAIREREVWYRQLFDHHPSPLLIVDPETGRMTDVNPAASAFYGYPREVMIGLPMAAINTLPPERIRAELMRVRQEPHARFLFAHRLASGELRQVEVDVSTLELGGRRQLFVIVHDVTARLETESQLRESVATQEILLRELSHRVKNHLQVISSLLSLQADQARDPGAKDALQESRGRVHALAILHDLLQSSQSHAHLDAGLFVERLTQELYRGHGVDPARVRCTLEISPVVLDLDRANCCALVLNELVTNALKHAFPDGRGGELRIGLGLEGGEVVLSVTDDGVGLPEHLNLDDPGTLGIGIVRSLAGQLDGRLSTGTGDLTWFELRFPREPAEGAP